MSKMKFELNLNHLKHTNLNQCSTRVLCLELLTELIPTYFISSLLHTNLQQLNLLFQYTTAYKQSMKLKNKIIRLK